MTYERLVERPVDGRGIPLGEGAWRLVVEMLFPEAGASVWGDATWNNGSVGDGVWSEVAWADVTDSVAGMTWMRGADEFGGRPRTGTLELTLRVTSADDFSPFGSSEHAVYYAPGTVVRVACIETSGAWIPQFAGVVESWPQAFHEVATNSTVTVRVVETPAFLARIDNNAVASGGAGQDIPARLGYLLTEAQWPYGLAAEADAYSPHTLQATDLAANRLAEVHLTCDSGDVVFYAHRSGVGLVRRADARHRPVDDLLSGEEWSQSAAEALYPQRLELNAGAVPGSAPWVDLDNNEYLEVPSFTTAKNDFTLAVQIHSPIPSASGVRTLLSKWGTNAIDQSWRFGVTGTSNIPYLEIRTSTGTSQTYTGSSPFPDLAYPIWVAVAFDASVSAASFWYRWTHDDHWRLQGIVPTGSAVSALRTSSTAIRVGDPVESTGVGVANRYRSAAVWADVTDGVPSPPAVASTPAIVKIAPEDITTADATGTTFTCTTGQTVTISGAGVLSAQAPVAVAASADFVVANDLEGVLNDVRLARVGGSEQVVEDTYSIGRWGQRITFSRGDLLNDNDADVAVIAARICDRRSRVRLRPTPLTVVARRGQTISNMPELFALDVGDMVTVRLPGSSRRAPAAIAAVQHEVALGLWWQAVFTFDVFSELTP